MKVDYLSDLHLDFYFDCKNRIKDEDIYKLFNPIITEYQRKVGDVLIIAGDISHYNHISLRILIYLRNRYYENIICVLGNHDYYIFTTEDVSGFKDSFERVDHMRRALNQEEGIFCLDGDLIKIDGVIFAGADSWYNEGYLERYHPEKKYTYEEINDFWKRNLNEYRYLKGVENFDDIYKIEIEKIKSIYKNCDVMISHICPCTKDEYFAAAFRGKMVNTFFSFSGEEFIKNTTAKHWIYGHAHEMNTFELYGVKCMVNAFGYPGESNYGERTKMKSFEVVL